MSQARPRPEDAQCPPASRASWPGSLVERALGLLAADYRRPTGPVIVAAVLTAASVVSTMKHNGPLALPVAMPLGVLATAPLAVGRRLPGTAIGVVLLANAAFLMFGRLSWPVTGVAAWLIALGACPTMLSRKRAVMAAALTEAAVLAAVFVPRSLNVTPWDATIAEALAVLAAWGAGEMLRSRRQSAVERAAAAEDLRRLSERDAIARERASMARELHDVVAHHVSMIAVRAATAPYAIDGLPPPGKAAFGEIADEARTALTELRTVLGVLRAPDGKPEEAPQPRIAGVGDLVRRMTSAGTDVRMTTTGQAWSLPASVELCGYRIVQEALTNAGRHAPGSQVRVELAYRDDAVRITVRDDGASHRAARSRPAPAAMAPAAMAPAAMAPVVMAPCARAAGEPAHGRADAVSGFGLAGLRERVAMLGGQFEAGPDEAGGFGVSALLPAAPAGSGART
jgi:signal transduction histidine kinase